MPWTAKSGAHLTAGMRAYANILAKALPFSFTITSGYRSAREQASAMLHKLREKGPQELRSLYRSNIALVEKLLKAPAAEDAWAAIIESEGMHLSRHLWQGAFDVRTRDLSTEQLAALRVAAAKTGGRPLTEFDHIHIDLPPRYAAMSAAETAGRLAAKIWLASVAVGAIALATAITVHRRRNRPMLPMKPPPAPAAPSIPASL